ncbi:hypothetical protein [Butyrivibrio sp. AD3002]|uniref:hypothetical protein n=1 Tax=Butyrivibrio sp. AD3002 TaxID=1280670 RepID=UPI0003B5170A|nr:hypothetical protein [Butyrivibrio sp. AD3002]
MLKKLLSIMASATIAVSSAFFIFPTAITVKAIVTGPHINVADKTYSIAAGSDATKQLYAYSDTAEIDSNLISGITYTWTKTDPQNIISEVSTNTYQYGSFLSITMSNIITDPNATATITITGTYNTSQTITSDVTVAVKPTYHITFDPNNINFTKGKAETRTVTTTFSEDMSGKNVTYKWKTNDVGIGLTNDTTSAVTITYHGYTDNRDRDDEGIVYFSVKVDGKDVELINATTGSVIEEGFYYNVLPDDSSNEKPSTPTDPGNSDTSNPPSDSGNSGNSEQSETDGIQSGQTSTLTSGTTVTGNPDGVSVTVTKTANKKSVKIVSTVTVNRKQYKVTKLSAGAISGKKVKNATIIAANLTSVSPKAFKGAKKLQKVVIIGVSRNSKIAKQIVKAARKVNKNVMIIYKK